MIHKMSKKILKTDKIFWYFCSLKHHDFLKKPTLQFNFQIISFILTLFLLKSPYSHASSNTNSNSNSSTKNDTKVSPRLDATPGSSEFHREGKVWDLNYFPIAAGPGPFIGTAGAFSYYINKNNLIQIEIMSAFRWRWIWSNYDVATRIATFNYKSFVGNSFYYKVGLSTYNTDYKYQDITYPNDRAQFNVTTLAATAGIGNQWSWQNLTLGCDWFGHTVPLMTTGDSSANVSASASTTTTESINNDYDTVTKKSSTYILRFYIGASF